MTKIIQGLTISNFTAFENVNMVFSPSVNIFLGENSTGKTHLLKLLYSVIKTCQHPTVFNNKKLLQGQLSTKLSNVFKPSSKNVGGLIRKGKQEDGCTIEVRCGNTSLSISFDSKGELSASFDQPITPKPSFYIPTNEFLSRHEGFLPAYLKRETSLDETYFDFSVALDGFLLRIQETPFIQSVVNPIKNTLGDDHRVERKKGRFYITTPDGELEAHLVSEGIAKIASLGYLTQNGSLHNDQTIFWDNPETNLSFQYVKLVAKIVGVLSRSGTQIFISTHDQRLVSELVRLSKQDLIDDIRLFSLYRDEPQSGIKSIDFIPDCA